MAAETHRERELAGLEVEEAEHRVRVVADDRLGMVHGDLLDLDAALGGAHQQDPARRAVQDGRHVVLGGDVGGRGDEHLAHRDALDVHPDDRRGDPLGLVGRGGQLHATGLAATADEDLGLDDHGLVARQQDPLRCGPCLGRRMGHFPAGNGQTLGHEQGLGVGFLDLHAMEAPLARSTSDGRGSRW